jgi:diacylglycerol kinase family enzyme
MMGGDGGLTNAIRALKNVTSLNKLQFVSLPFGSGNDTS